MKDYNERTASQAGTIVPVHITVYQDRSFTFVTRTPPASELIRKVLNIESGSGLTGRETVGTIKRQDIENIAQSKMKDLNAASIEGAIRIIEGTARSMGVKIED